MESYENKLSIIKYEWKPVCVGREQWPHKVDGKGRRKEFSYSPSQECGFICYELL